VTVTDTRAYYDAEYFLQYKPEATANTYLMRALMSAVFSRKERSYVPLLGPNKLEYSEFL
jgi:hypothetical protein